MRMAVARIAASSVRWTNAKPVRRIEEARKGLFDSIAGKAKEMAGAVTGKDDLVEEGQLQQAEARKRELWNLFHHELAGLSNLDYAYIASELGKRLNQQVIVENRPGLPGTTGQTWIHPPQTCAGNGNATVSVRKSLGGQTAA